MNRLLLTLLAVLVSNARTAWMGPFEKADAAIARGDYTTGLGLRMIGSLAAQGDPRAQFDLGALYERDRGVAQNYSEAVNWYRPPAE